jgi:hypothetical protein
MIRKGGQVGFEGIAGGEQFVLASGHGGKCLRRIFSHGLTRCSQLFPYVNIRPPFAFIGSAEHIELLRNIRREWNSKNQNAVFINEPDNIIQLSEPAPVVAGFADQ